MRDADEADLQSKLKEMLSLKNLNEHLYSVANRPKISNEENDHHQQQPEKPQELQHQQQQQHISSISTQGKPTHSMVVASFRRLLILAPLI